MESILLAVKGHIGELFQTIGRKFKNEIFLFEPPEDGYNSLLADVPVVQVTQFFQHFASDGKHGHGLHGQELVEVVEAGGRDLKFSKKSKPAGFDNALNEIVAERSAFFDVDFFQIRSIS